jgi:hypothetical protein
MLAALALVGRAAQAQVTDGKNFQIPLEVTHSSPSVAGETTSGTPPVPVNAIGTSETASDFKGLEDKINLPTPPSGFVDLYIIHPLSEPGNTATQWRRDIRAPIAAGQTKTWNLGINTDTAGTVTLTWGSLSAIPSYLQITLLDPRDANGDQVTSYDMRGQTAFSYTTSPATQLLSIRITNTTPPPPLLLTDLKISDATDTGFTVSWTTDTPSSSVVEYGKTADLGQTASTPGDPVTSHVVHVTGLTPNTTYSLRARSSALGFTDAVSSIETQATLDALAFVTPPITLGVTSTQAFVHVSTNMAADVTVDFGTDPQNLNLQSKTDKPGTDVDVLLTGLAPTATYTARVTATAPNREPRVSTLSFTTSAQTQFSPAPTVTDIGAGAATISFGTDTPSTAVVDYGTSQTYNQQKADSNVATSHQIVLTDLSAETTYHFKVTADSPTNGIVSTQDLTFTTLALIPFSDFKVGSITRTDAVVTINTGVPSTAVAEYGTSETDLSGRVLGTTEGTSHSLTLGGLTANTGYKVRVRLQATGKGETVTDLLTFKTAPNRRPGDIVGTGGKPTIADVLLCIRFALHAQTPTSDQAGAADMNGDGQVNISDVLKLLRVVLGLDPQPA